MMAIFMREPRAQRYGSAWIVGGDKRTRRRLMGEPSDSNRSSYFLPFLSVAEHETLETCLVAKFPSCRQTPLDNSTSGSGRPSTFGRSFDFTSIRSTARTYRFSCMRLPYSPEKEMTWLSSVGSSSATVKLARPFSL